MHLGGYPEGPCHPGDPILSEIIYAYGTLEPPPRLRVTGVRLDGVARPDLIDQAGAAVDLFEDRVGVAAGRARPGAGGRCRRRPGIRGASWRAGGDRRRASPSRPGRQSARLARSRCDEGRWEGIDRARPGQLSRPGLPAAAADRRGRRGPHRLAAEAAGWTVHFDEPAGLRLGGRLRVRWVDFTAVDAPLPARQFPDSTHVVSFGAGDEPPESG